MSSGSSDEQREDVLARVQGEVLELRRSRKRVVEAADADRRAIERALHDGAQQHLVALAVDLQRLAGLVDSDPPATKALIGEMAAKLQGALDETRELAQMVYPQLLEGRGLASALRSAAERAGVTLVVDVQAGIGYPSQVTAVVYWSCVDALSSASRGSEATISVVDEDGVLRFEVAVDGPYPGERLDRLRDSIEALDGRIIVEDQHDGSRVHGWLPLSR